MVIRWLCSTGFWVMAMGLVLLAGLAAAAAPQAPAGPVRWNGRTRSVELVGPDGRPWLVEAAARVVLSDGSVIASSDPRYTVTVTAHLDRWVLAGVDARQVLDWEMVVGRIDDQAVRIDWTIINRGKAPLKLDRLEVLTGRLTGRTDARHNRVLVSGENSWSGGNVASLEEGKAVESYYTLAVEKPVLAAGFLAGNHNLDRFRLTGEQGGWRLTAYGECNGCLLPAGSRRQADPLYLAGGGHPLGRMEQFADLAARENGVQLWPENFATWCSWYAGWIRQEPLHNYKGGLEKGVEVNIPLVARFLGRRGTPCMRIVDDSNEMPFGDWDNRTLAIPGGFDRLAGMMAGKGIRAGVWYPPFWVSTKSRLYRQHPQWLCRDDDGQVFVARRGIADVYGNNFAYLDASHPQAEQYIEQVARAWRRRGFRYVMTDFLKWGAWGKQRHDSTLTAVEVHNRGLDAMRRGYGKDTYWLHCGALLGPAMGRCDGMRISGDSHGGAIYSYVSTGARWFYNWRVWVNDPDAIVCIRRGQAKSVDWNRTWMSWMALAGTVLTYGDTLDDLPEAYRRLYQRVLPPIRVAGRPLDLFENRPYLLWGMAPGRADGDYTLLGVFEFQGRRVGQKITLNLDEVAARSRSWTDRPDEAPQRWLLWDFWQQKLTEVDGAKLTIAVPEKSCRVFALRPDLGRPQLLGTSGHISQGVLEVPQIRWDGRRRRLTGKVKGNGGDPTQLFIYVPGSMQCVEVYVDYKPQQVKLAKSGATGKASVVTVEVPAVPGEPVPFELQFEGQAGQPRRRPFVAGPVGQIHER